jgi:hypothetical protein
MHFPDPTPPGREGAALPFALLALLILSLLAAGLLLSSSTERVLSRTHVEATEELYLAEGAVHAWIAARGHHLAAEAVDSWLPPGGTAPVRIMVERLAAPGGPGDADRNTLFAVHAEPARQGGGRGVVALMRARQQPLPDLDVDLGAAITAGESSSASVTAGSATVVTDGTDHPLCPVEDGRAGSAWLLARDRSLSLVGGAQLAGSVTVSTDPTDALLRSVLRDLGIRDLAWNAGARFGRHFNEPSFPAEPQPVHSSHPDPRFRWGCPADVIDAVRASATASSLPPPCPAGADTAAYVTVAIDAENRTIVLDGEHAQGILIVLNGSLHLRDRFVFKGLILAERDVRISGGGGNWPPSIEGAIVARGGVAIEGGAGARAVRFNRCAIDRAQAAFNGPIPGTWGTPRLIGRPHGWFEVTR